MSRICMLGTAMAVASLVAGCGGGDSGGTAAVPICAVSAVTRAAQDGAAPLRVESLRRDGPDQSPLQARTSTAAPWLSVSLGALSQARVAAAVQSSTLGVPRRTGLPREVLTTASVESTMAVLHWQSTASGGQLAAISFSSDAALGLRLGLLVRSLPAQATLRVYAQGSGTAYVVPAQEVLDSLQRNADAGDTRTAAQIYWTPLVEGAEATLEIELPAQVSTDSVQIAIPRLSHMLVSPLEAGGITARSIGAAGVCERDVACDSAYSSAESNAVARMSFVAVDGISYTCTGTLLNDSSSSGTPYFLSANHCISQQVEASSLQTYWFYRASSCGSGSLSSASRTVIGGATLLYASNSTDTSFMRLASAPPTGALYAGWLLAAATPGASVAGLHHPQGDLQKISTGTLASFQSCSVLTASTPDITCSTSTQAGGNYLNAVFSSGITEQGSSGSPLFQSSAGGHYLVGQLYGGSSSCSAPSGSNIYGRFDVAYSAALSRWLTPSASTCR